MGASASFQPTLGSLFNPMNLVHAVQTLRHPPVRDIISGFNGVVRPGEMLREYTVSQTMGVETDSVQLSLVALGQAAAPSSRFSLTTGVGITRSLGKSCTPLCRRVT